MARILKKIEISLADRAALETLHRTDERHCVRQRSQMVLLKTEGYRSAEIGRIVGSCEASVNGWVTRFEQVGIQGLYNQEGQGRKALLVQDDISVVRAAVTQERQRLSQAKLIIERDLGKRFSQKTLTRFLKVITAGTNG